LSNWAFKTTGLPVSRQSSGILSRWRRCISSATGWRVSRRRSKISGRWRLWASTTTPSCRKFRRRSGGFKGVACNLVTTGPMSLLARIPITRIELVIIY